MKQERKAKIMYGFGFAVIVAGLILNYFGIGSPDFQVFGGIGNWLIYIGFVSFVIATVRLLTKKKQRKIDERMLFVATKALRITFLFLILAAFVIMVIDGIKTITAPYYLFMSSLICILMIVYFVSYKVLLGRN